jgi:hypothetical protein
MTIRLLQGRPKKYLESHSGQSSISRPQEKPNQEKGEDERVAVRTLRAVNFVQVRQGELELLGQRLHLGSDGTLGERGELVEEGLNEGGEDRSEEELDDDSEERLNRAI